ncbi:MAG: hypothetical protein AAB784_01780 [Patescibacteria group bacterium]
MRTHGSLESTMGLLVARKHLDARQPNKEGEVKGWVPGHGGDVWWVAHNDETVGAYSFEEFEPV